MVQFVTDDAELRNDVTLLAAAGFAPPQHGMPDLGHTDRRDGLCVPDGLPLTPCTAYEEIWRHGHRPGRIRLGVQAIAAASRPLASAAGKFVVSVSASSAASQGCPVGVCRCRSSAGVRGRAASPGGAAGPTRWLDRRSKLHSALARMAVVRQERPCYSKVSRGYTLIFRSGSPRHPPRSHRGRRIAVAQGDRQGGGGTCRRLPRRRLTSPSYPRQAWASPAPRTQPNGGHPRSQSPRGCREDRHRVVALRPVGPGAARAADSVSGGLRGRWAGPTPSRSIPRASCGRPAAGEEGAGAPRVRSPRGKTAQVVSLSGKFPVLSHAQVPPPPHPPKTFAELILNRPSGKLSGFAKAGTRPPDASLGLWCRNC